MKKQFPLFGLAFVMAFILIGNLGQASAAGNQSGAQASGAGKVSIFVLDHAKGTPIKKAIVQIKLVDGPAPVIISGYTDPTGMFSTMAPAGMYAVQAKAVNYAIGYTKVQVNPNAPVAVKVGLDSVPGPGGVPARSDAQVSGASKVSVVVLDTTKGTPIKGAFVQMRSVNSPVPTVISGYTDPTGMFSTMAPAGMYAVQVKAAHYSLGYAKVLVSPNAPISVKVGLNSVPGPIAVP